MLRLENRTCRWPPPLSTLCSVLGGADDDDPLCDLPRMEVWSGTFTGLPQWRIYSHLSLALCTPRYAVCCRPQTSTFDPHGSRTSSCRETTCDFGNDDRGRPLGNDRSLPPG